MTFEDSRPPVLGPAPTPRGLSHRVISWWNAIAQERLAPLVIFGVWFVVAVPPALFRGYHYVEGLTVAIAQSALRYGHWLTPHLDNFRFIERPTLLSWIVAALSYPFSHVDPFAARLPTILCLLAGCFLIWRTLRPLASAAAALAGTASFLASPIVMRYYWTSVADIPLAVLLFGTFLLWWNSFSAGRLTAGRWIAIGCLLGIAGLFKGPQPVAYFFLGLGAFTLLTRTWPQIWGLVLAGAVAALPVALWYAYVFVPGDQGEWLRYTRLSSTVVEYPHPISNAIKFYFEALPAAIFASALLVTPKASVTKTVPANFILALSCYAFACTLALLLWPADVNPRYILPMTLPLCVLAGLGYDALLQRAPVLAASCICVMTGILGYSAVHSTIEEWVWPQTYRRSKITGAQIADLVHQFPAPVYRTAWNSGLNELAYVPVEILTVSFDAVASVAKPAWIVAPDDEAGKLIAVSSGHITAKLALDGSILLRLQ